MHVPCVALGNHQSVNLISVERRPHPHCPRSKPDDGNCRLHYDEDYKGNGLACAVVQGAGHGEAECGGEVREAVAG